MARHGASGPATDGPVAEHLGTIRFDRGRVFVVFYPDPDGPKPWTVGVF